MFGWDILFINIVKSVGFCGICNVVIFLISLFIVVLVLFLLLVIMKFFVNSEVFFGVVGLFL